MEANYAEKLKQALTKDLPALKVRIDPNDILVKEKPDGDYSVEVRVRTERRETPRGASFEVGPIVKETYTVDEAIETKGDLYKQKTRRLAEQIRKALGGL